ncbi:MAG: NTP transferase domain-containing protein [Chthoniobacter sp.]|nr:NTP transferase domain-containing protein [Chthoniobacter sp.]
MPPIRTAFVLGAGLGTRLRAVTMRRPKPLIPVVNRPLISYAFDHLLEVGIQRLVVNTHWQAERYAEFFPSADYRGAKLIFRHESPEVLETAGGIWNVRDLLRDEPFIVYNGDIFTDLPLAPALRAHRERGNEVTLILRSADGPLQIACDTTSGRVTDLSHQVDPASDLRFLFTGIYIVCPEFIRRIPPATKISVIPIFCEMIRAGAKLGGVVIDDGSWRDLGSREQYLAVHSALAQNGMRPDEWIHPTAHVASDARISGATAIAPGARVGAGAVLRDCLVWENAEVAPGADLTRCIVTRAARAEGTQTDFDFA